MSREQEQGTPEWYVAELRALASAITGRGVGVCNGAALTIERLREQTASSTQAVDLLSQSVPSRYIDKHGQDGDMWVRLHVAEAAVRAASSTTPASGGDAHEWAVKHDADTFLSMQPHDVSADWIAGWNTCRAHVIAQKYQAAAQEGAQGARGDT